MQLVPSRRWLGGFSSCRLVFAAMWATLAGPQRTERVGDVLDAVCMLRPAGGSVTGGGGNLVITCLIVRKVKENYVVFFLICLSSVP